MTSIYLIRHGQTAWNKEEIFRGKTDIPLDETGLRQATVAAKYFEGVRCQAIYSSPLQRAWQTAQKIAETLGLEVTPLPGITDMSFGTWEGQALKDVQRDDHERYEQWKKAPHKVKLPNGETLDEVRDRAMTALGEVIKKHGDETVILVSHRVINKVLLCAILGLDNSHFWQVSQDPTAINLIQYRNGNYILALMNESCHLRALSHDRARIDF